MSAKVVDLPLPDKPTTPVVQPALNEAEKLRNTRARGRDGYENVTDTNSNVQSTESDRGDGDGRVKGAVHAAQQHSTQTWAGLFR
jgi:hypothetical protein